MKISTLLSLILLASGLLHAQNLVPNPSFETVLSAPCSWLTAPSQLPAAVANWTMPSNGSTDIFTNYVATTCYAHNFSTNGSASGQQAPHTGNAQSALVMYGSGCGSNYREYLQVQLTTALTPGQMYDLSFWVSMMDYCYLATGNFGMRFGIGSTFVSTCDNLALTPQFVSTPIVTNKTGWVQISGTVTATAAWNQIIIGNFANNAGTPTQNVGGTILNARYFIDDISVAHVILAADPGLVLQGGRGTDGVLNLTWNALPELPPNGYILQSSRDGDSWETLGEFAPAALSYQDRFAPNVSLRYRLRYSDANGQVRTSNTLEMLHNEDLPYRLYLSNNPAAVGSTCSLRITNADDAPATLDVHDLGGRKIWSSESKPLVEWDNFMLPSTEWQPGIYFISLQVGGSLLNTKLVISR